MAERMAFILDGDDNLSPVFRRIGESAERFHQRINEAVDESGGELRAFTRGAGGQLRELGENLSTASRAAEDLGEQSSVAAPQVQAVGEAADDAGESVARFTRDSNGRLRDLRGRFLTAAAAAEHLAQASSEASSEVREVGEASSSTSERTSRLGGTASRATPQLAELGSAAEDAAVKVGGKGGGLGGALAAIAALSLLPSLGALVPMLAGLGVAAGTMKLGFSGVGEAVAAAGKGKKEYAAALKELSPEARAFTKELVSTKKEFSGLSDEIQKVMLPGFTEALKESGPLAKILGDAMTEMGKGFGNAAAGVGRLMQDSGFQKEFTTVLQLGNTFVRDLTRGLGGLTRAFLTFGAASAPTLQALSGGIGDLLGKGLPGMFRGLERGIDGSSKFLSGFFGMINEVLPKLGEFAGEVARTFGPLLGEQATLFGRVVSRALDLVGYGVRLLKPIMDDLGFGLKAVWLLAQPFASAFKDAGKAIAGALLPAGKSIDDVRGPLQRLHTAVQENKLGLMEFARIGAGFMLTTAEGIIRYLPDAIAGFRLLAMGALVNLDIIISGLAMTIGKIPGFGEKFQEANRDFDRFKDSFLGGLETAEEKTRSFSNSVLPRLSENRLKMDISNYESQIGVAKEQLKSVPPEKRSTLSAHIADLERKAAAARAELASIRDRSVSVTLTYVTRGSMNNRTRLIEGLAGGGIVRGPGTSTSDSIPRMLSDGEYVLQASTVSRIGVANLDALNQGRALALPATGAAAVAAPAVSGGGGGITFAPQITVNGALDPIAVAQQMEKLLLKLQRSYGLPTGVLAR